MPVLPPGKTANRIQPNASSLEQNRRNWQRLSQGGATAYISVTPPLTNTDGTLGFAFDSSVFSVVGDVFHFTLLTTKGDIMAFETAPVRVGVGANGTVLTANSAATGGVFWTVPIVPTLQAVTDAGSTTTDSVVVGGLKDTGPMECDGDAFFGGSSTVFIGQVRTSSGQLLVSGQVNQFAQFAANPNGAQVNNPGAVMQVFDNGFTGREGQMYLDSGSNDNAGIFLRTAQTSGSVAVRLQITADGATVLGTLGTPPAPIAGGLYYDGVSFYKCADGINWVAF